ncbi:hypothetical protein BpHYR1_025060 [Brachionus plicatilis]|uniref:Uncharacterized protein n=1 Tax=Brachionus plicatilis TaxID=10195 RepID=A0A3M7SEP0_BRAPC|nr:hypothetical protein BpHYR1_025060 [Brachionus plicatilis]
MKWVYRNYSTLIMFRLNKTTSLDFEIKFWNIIFCILLLLVIARVAFLIMKKKCFCIPDQYN